MSARGIRLNVNGQMMQGAVEARRTLADFLREDLGLTGTHLGCEHGVCGACTVLLDGLAIRSCLVLAIQADGREVRTVEGLEEPGGGLHPIQRAFSEEYGLQCGFCTPGFLMTVVELLSDDRDPDEGTIRAYLNGNLCRCTGYHNIVKAVRSAAARVREEEAGE